MEELSTMCDDNLHDDYDRFNHNQLNKEINVRGEKEKLNLRGEMNKFE